MAVTVYKYQDTIADPVTGRPVAGAAVTVKIHGSGTVATLYDEAGAVTQPNPVYTDSMGFFCFWTVAGNYDFACSFGGVSVSRTGIIIGTLVPTLAESFGAKGDGVADDAAAINALLSSVGYGKANLVGHYIIGSSVIVPTGVTLEGINQATTRIIKKASFTGTGVIMAGYGSHLHNIMITQQDGATGDMLQIAHGNVVVRDVAVQALSKLSTTGNGIRIGKDSGPSNCNNWLLENVVVRNMSGHGVLVHDKPGCPPDANAGLALHVETEDNGGDGIREDNAQSNTYIGHLSQGNVNGIHFTGNSVYSSLFGGDREANSGHDILIDAPIRAASNQIEIAGIRVSEDVVDNGVANKLPYRNITKQGAWTPVLEGSTTPGTQTYVIQFGFYQRSGDWITVQGQIRLSAKDAATAGYIRITGLPIPCATITNAIFTATISSWEGFTFPAGYTSISGFVANGTSYITLQRMGTAQTVSPEINTTELAAGGSNIAFQVTYPIAVW